MENDAGVIVAAKGFLVHKGKVLVLRKVQTAEYHDNVGKYQLPGGRLQPGESFLGGLRREVKEECGLELATIGRPLFVFDWWPTIKGHRAHIVGIFMLCTPKNGEVHVGDEHDGFEWIDPTEHASCNLMENEHQVFEAYLKLGT